MDGGIKMQRPAFIRPFAACLLIVLSAQAWAGEVSRGPKKAHGQSVLAREIELPNLKGACLENAAGLALDAARVPGGIILARPCAQQSRHNYAFRVPASLRDVIKVIASANPSYAWSIKGGVVNIAPRVQSPPILDTRISAFDSGSATALEAAVNMLLQLPEIRDRMKDLGFEEGFNSLQGYRVLRKQHASSETQPRELGVKVEEVSLREALNAIVRANGRGVWVYEEYRTSGKRYFRISFESN
jgi:hypothetical protein